MRPERHHYHPVVAATRVRVLTILFFFATAIALALPASAQNDADMDALFEQLARPEGEAWRIAESDILREWSKSGSAAKFGA